MELIHAAECLEALGNETRLEIFRLLIRAGHEGAAVGTLQERLAIPASTLSHHLARLVRVGLVSQERRSRTLICRADYRKMDTLMSYLGDNCCGGLEEVDKRRPPIPHDHDHPVYDVTEVQSSTDRG